MKELIVSFTHSNYCIRPAGTEKFVRNLSVILQQAGYMHLNFFSFYTDDTSVGVNYNDKFIGIFKYEDIAKIIAYYIENKQLTMNSIHFQHLLNHKLADLKKIVYVVKVPVCLVLHDYYLVCNDLKLINSKGEFCGISEPTNEKCRQCENVQKGIEHFKQIKDFVDAIDDYVYELVAPSKYVADGFSAVFPDFKNRIKIRPHLRIEGYQDNLAVIEKIKLAYVGVQMKEKGYDEWRKLTYFIQENCPQAYDLYYFGTGKDTLNGVTNVYVSTSEQGESAMVDHLKQYNISCAFVWPNWAETYSYVYYELSVCGIFIVSNKISGNIYSEITEKQNGRIFENFEAAEQWFLAPEKALQEINDYRSTGQFKPFATTINDDLSNFIEVKNNASRLRGIVKKPTQMKLKTFLYKMKYRKYHI